VKVVNIIKTNNLEEFVKLKETYQGKINFSIFVHSGHPDGSHCVDITCKSLKGAISAKRVLELNANAHTWKTTCEIGRYTLVNHRKVYSPLSQLELSRSSSSHSFRFSESDFPNILTRTRDEENASRDASASFSQLMKQTFSTTFFLMGMYFDNENLLGSAECAREPFVKEIIVALEESGQQIPTKGANGWTRASSSNANSVDTQRTSVSSPPKTCEPIGVESSVSHCSKEDKKSFLPDYIATKNVICNYCKFGSENWTPPRAFANADLSDLQTHECLRDSTMPVGRDGRNINCPFLRQRKCWKCNGFGHLFGNCPY
jgi:hypothetical protein